MIKTEELSNPNSCLNRAKDDELLFVLKEDVAAPSAVREWARKRVSLGKNTWEDPQIKEALEWADKVEDKLTSHEARSTQSG